MDISQLARFGLFAGTAIFAGCAGMPLDQIELMPAPDVYGDGMLNPLPMDDPFETSENS